MHLLNPGAAIEAILETEEREKMERLKVAINEMISTPVCRGLSAEDSHKAREFFESKNFIEFFVNHPAIERNKDSSLSHGDTRELLKDIFEILPEDISNTIKVRLESQMKYEEVLDRHSKHLISKLVEAVPKFLFYATILVSILTLLYLLYGSIKHFIFDGVFSFSTPLYLLGGCIVGFILAMILLIIIGLIEGGVAKFVAKSESKRDNRPWES